MGFVAAPDAVVLAHHQPPFHTNRHTAAAVGLVASCCRRRRGRNWSSSTLSQEKGLWRRRATWKEGSRRPVDRQARLTKAIVQEALTDDEAPKRPKGGPGTSASLANGRSRRPCDQRTDHNRRQGAYQAAAFMVPVTQDILPGSCP